MKTKLKLVSMSGSTLFLVRAAAIAAIYIVVCLLFAPIGSGLVQCRISEALCILPCFTPAAIPGLFIGCVLANLLTGNIMLDVALGSLATLLAAIATYFIGRRFEGNMRRFLAPLPAVAVNAIIVGWLLTYAYEVGVSYWLSALYVAVGQLISCYGLGLPLMAVLNKHKAKLF